jgi:hypothetical protein
LLPPRKVCSQKNVSNYIFATRLHFLNIYNSSDIFSKLSKISAIHEISEKKIIFSIKFRNLENPENSRKFLKFPKNARNF